VDDRQASDAQWTVERTADGALRIGGPFALVTADQHDKDEYGPAVMFVHAELLYADAAALIDAVVAA
jgi:hypothetical protein